MIFLPYGNDTGPVRFPWVTTIVVIACLAVHVFTWVRDSEREGRLSELAAREEKLAAVEKLAGRHLQGFDRALREAGIVAREDQDVTDSVHRALAEVRARRAALEAEMIVPRYGLVPARRGPWWTYLTHAFLHDGWFHLLGNLLFLWLSAANLEHRFGAPRLAFLYTAGVVAAGLFFALWHPDMREPSIGASGAVSAMIGAFLVSLYRTRIRVFWFAMWFLTPRWGTFAVPAWAAIPFWLAAQLLGAGMEASISMGVAYSAHLGGFAVGLVVASLFEVLGRFDEDDGRASYGPPRAETKEPAAAPGLAARPFQGSTFGRRAESGPASTPVPEAAESAPRDPRAQVLPFLRRFPEADPARARRIEEFLSWRSGRPGHLLTQAHVSMYLGSLRTDDATESHEIRSLLIAFVDFVEKDQGRRFQTTTSSLTRLPQPSGEESSAAGKVLGLAMLLVVLGVGGHFWGRIAASRDCARLEDALGERRESLIDNTRTTAEIGERVRAMAEEWKIEAAPDDVDVGLEPLTFVTLTKLPGDEMFALGVGPDEGANPNAVLTVAVDAPAPRLLATGRCRFERVMRVITAGKLTPLSDLAKQD